MDTKIEAGEIPVYPYYRGEPYIKRAAKPDIVPPRKRLIIARYQNRKDRELIQRKCAAYREAITHYAPTNDIDYIRNAVFKERYGGILFVCLAVLSALAIAYFSGYLK